jgi:iron complex transport system permease protein
VTRSASRSRRAAIAGLLVLAGLLLLLVSVGVAITLGPADILLVNVRDIVTNHLGLTDIAVKVSP